MMRLRRRYGLKSGIIYFLEALNSCDGWFVGVVVLEGIAFTIECVLWHFLRWVR